MSKFVVIVVDGFGIGAMQDVENVRPIDKGANTCLNILKQNSSLYLPNFERLGLMNALGVEMNGMRFQQNACFGRADLMHDGADTFMGHQEILGTKPKIPLRLPFSEVIFEVKKALEIKDYEVEMKGADWVESQNGDSFLSQLHYLWVNNAVAIGDNLEADLGQVFNLTADLNSIGFEELVNLAKVVRENVKVDRVIAFGGLLDHCSQIQAASEIKENKYIGINAPKSGAYDKGFKVIHLGYGVDSSVQVPALLNEIGIGTTLIGKVADIVNNPNGVNYMQLVDTETILSLTLDAIKQPGDRFICANIQESDLSGHAQSVQKYSDILSKTDKGLKNILENLSSEDLLIVMADHGNDPTIGHSKHTREQVPLLIYKKGLNSINVGQRSSLSDVGATVCEFFSANAPQNGCSFLSKLR